MLSNIFTDSGIRTWTSLGEGAIPPPATSIFSLCASSTVLGIESMKEREYLLSRKVIPTTNIYEGSTLFQALFKMLYVCIHSTNIKGLLCLGQWLGTADVMANTTHRNRCPHREDSKRKKINLLDRRIL